jgi:hypothetical protein
MMIFASAILLSFLCHVIVGGDEETGNTATVKEKESEVCPLSDQIIYLNMIIKN